MPGAARGIPLAFAVLLAFTGAIPSVRADAIHEVDTLAPTGEYLDLATMRVYRYDAAKGILTLTDRSAPTVTAFVMVDAYRRGELPNPLTGDLHGPCPADACTASLVAIVNPGIIKEIVFYSGDCYTYRMETTLVSDGLVAYLRGWSAGNMCGSGTATVRALVNGETVAVDSVTF